MRHPSIVLALAAAALSACGPTVSYHRAPDVPIPPGARWAWGPPDADGLAIRDGALVPADSIARLVADAIERELTAKGFTRSAADQAAFIVHFHVGQRTVTDTLPPRDDAPPNVRAPGTWGGYGRPEELADRTVTWQEGMLIVDAVAADRGVVAWRGIIADEIPPGAATRPREAIAAAVRQLMRGFP